MKLLPILCNFVPKYATTERRLIIHTYAILSEWNFSVKKNSVNLNHIYFYSIRKQWEPKKRRKNYTSSKKKHMKRGGTKKKIRSNIEIEQCGTLWFQPFFSWLCSVLLTIVIATICIRKLWILVKWTQVIVVVVVQFSRTTGWICEWHTFNFTV